MDSPRFYTADGDPVPAVTTDEMREVDRVAVEEFGLSIRQMMEHAGRTLAAVVLDTGATRVTVFAGRGGNGGGALACARHLATRGRLDRVICSRPRDAFSGAPARQLRVLERMAVPIQFVDSPPSSTATAATSTEPTSSSTSSLSSTPTSTSTPAPSPETDCCVDGLIGYGLDGSPRAVDANLIETLNACDAHTVSLDVPSGVDATTGFMPDAGVDPQRILTLALPKAGLADYASDPRRLELADIGIPAAVYDETSVSYHHPFGEAFCVPLIAADD